MCNLMHFVDEIRMYRVQDRGVHGNRKSHGNVILWESNGNGNSHMLISEMEIKQRKKFINVYTLNYR